MEDDNPLLQVAAVRKECATLRAHFATENARLEALASSALAECEQQRQEIARLRASNHCESCGGEADGSSAAALTEAVIELERAEQALTEERLHNAKLLEEKLAIEDNHSRDVAMLERMLQQVLTENERLQATVSAWEATKTASGGPEAINEENQAQLPKDAVKDAAVDGNGEGQNFREVLDEPEMEPRRACVVPSVG